MAAAVPVTCPNCQNALNVPADILGKRIRCKKCQETFVATAAGAARPAAARPAAAKPAAAKPVAPPTPPPPPADAPIGFKPDDDDEDENPYTVTKVEGEEVPRCPFCALELDPPDTKVCLNCGYDLMERKRHETLHTIEHTAADWILHLAPGFACVLAIILLLVFDVICFLNMRSWMTGGMLESDDKDPITDQKKFYIPPYCFNLWLLVMTLFVVYLCGKFAYKRLVLNWTPREKVVKDVGGD